MIKRLLHPLLLRRDERWPALIVLLLSTALNALFILRLNPLFRQPGLGPYKAVLEHEFHLSGYDPYTYWCVSDWDYYYNVVRHPLLAWMVWPIAQLNSLLGILLGINCVQFLMAVILVICTVYSFVFLYRILLKVIGVGRADALLLSAFFFSMAYIMLSAIVPDHFTPSMMLLLLTLYLSGRILITGRQLQAWQWGLLLFTTAGITLTNGAKVVLAFVATIWAGAKRPYPWRQWRLKAIAAIALPSAVLIGAAAWQQQTITLPRQQSSEAMQQRKAEQEEQRIASLPAEEQKKERARQARRQKVLLLQAKKSGKPMAEEGLLRWTDVSTSRWKSLYENMMGESILFHQRHFLEDTLVGRPVFVLYIHWWAYAVEATVAAMFLLGIWKGRRNPFLWLSLSMFGIDLFVHLLLGFGLNEIHIMAPHWLFVVPIAVAFAFLRSQGATRWTLRSLTVLLTALLLVCNSCQLVTFLLKPIKTIL